MNYEKLDSIVLSLKDELLADMKRWIAVPSVGTKASDMPTAISPTAARRAPRAAKRSP